MCDLIVAADDAVFQNPVLRMTGAGVELLVEPWELGTRKAKEFLLHRRTRSTPQEAVAARAREQGRAARRAGGAPPGRWPTRSRSCRRSPPQVVKDVDQPHASTCMGQRDSWQYHFMVHHFDAQHADRARRARGAQAKTSMKEVFADRDRGDAPTLMSGPARRAARPRPRHPHRRAVLRRPARRAWAPRSSRSSSPARGDFMREIGPFAAATTARTRCSGRSRAGAARASRSTCASPRARTCSAGWPRTADVVVRELPARHARALEHRPGRPRPPARHRAHLRVRPGRPVLASARASTASASATAGCCTSPATPTGRRCASGVTISDYLTGVFAAQAARRRALRARRHAARARARSSTPRSTARCCASSSGRSPAYDRLGVVREREGNRLANSAPLDNYPTADGKYVCIVAGSDANFAPAVRGDGPARLARRSRASRRWPTGPRTATRSTASSRSGRRRCTAAEVEAALRRPRRPGRHRVHRRRHLRRPPHRRPRRPRHRRRPGARPVRQQAPFPRFVGEPAAGADAARRASASTPTRCSATLLGLDDAELDRARGRGVV